MINLKGHDRLSKAKINSQNIDPYLARIVRDSNLTAFRDKLGAAGALCKCTLPDRTNVDGYSRGEFGSVFTTPAVTGDT